MFHICQNMRLIKFLRSAEMKGGVRLGVAFNLRRTAFLLVNEDTIVICGHEYCFRCYS